MNRSQEIIRTSWIGIAAKNNYLSVDIVPDITVHDEVAFVSQLTAELQPLVPDQQVVIVVDHNYSEWSTPSWSLYSVGVTPVCFLK